MEITNKKRNSNFELLRIVAIVMVLILHYFNGGMGGGLKAIPQTTNFYIGCFMESLCVIGVNCFVIITGYFMVNRNSVKLDKPIYLILMCIFYGGGCYIISVVLKLQTFTFDALKDALIFVYDSKWFVGSYVVLYLLIPYLNKITHKLSMEKYKRLVIILIIVFSIFPSLFSKVSFNDKGYGVLSFIMLYFLGGYLKLHYKANKSKIWYFMIYVLCSLTTTFLVLNDLNNGVYWSYNSVLNIISTISLFLFFSKLNIKSNIINYLSKFSFAIYIIHSDASIRTFIYRKIFNSEMYWNHPHMPINMIKTIIGIYFGCVLIDIIRRIIIKPISRKIKILDTIEISA